MSVESVVSPEDTRKIITDLHIPAAKISYFSEVDLGKFSDLPNERQDLVALSIRIEAAFIALMGPARAIMMEGHNDVPAKVREAVARVLALDFIERYGVLALLSGTVLQVFWEAQRPTSKTGPKFLREVGLRLAVFAMAGKDVKTTKTIDIAFTLGKRNFLGELQQLSCVLGSLDPDGQRVERLLELVATGKYEMLQMNLEFLKQFLLCKEENPHLHAQNEVVVDQLARYGARGLTIEDGLSITPDWFFYTWVGWMTNKSPRTVRREIQTAQSKFKAKITKLILVTKNQ